jgi:hypothetical protein
VAFNIDHNGILHVSAIEKVKSFRGGGRETILLFFFRSHLGITSKPKAAAWRREPVARRRAWVSCQKES